VGPRLQRRQPDGIVRGADQDDDRGLTGGRAQGREALQARVARQVEIDEDGVGLAAGEPFAAAREIGDGLDLPGAAAGAGEARFDRAGILRVSYDEEDTQAVAIGSDGAHISRTTILRQLTARSPRARV
jgi:hypothetical protein